jgi:4'-phosphopantetheinyl transferase
MMSSATPGEVWIWHARTADAWADPARLDRALEWLSAVERARHDRYRFDADRQMFLLGRVMARTLVGRALETDPRAWEWREGQRGRPEVSADSGALSFNLAHSAGLVVCALSRDAEVGADVEHRLRPPSDPHIVRRFCSPAEIADVERQGPTGWRDQFLRYWTLKEAYLKARGVGIAVPLADVSFTLGDGHVRVEFLNTLAGTDTNWAFALAESGATHFIAAAASTRGDAPPRFLVAPFTADLLP